MVRPNPKKPRKTPHSWLRDLKVELAEQLDADGTERWRRRWYETFAVEVKAATEAWRDEGYDWHAFSRKYRACLSSGEAVSAYRATLADKLVAVPDGEHNRPRYGAIVTGDHPVLSRTDALVFPENLAWTMAFTHEEPSLGPFFAKR